MANQESGREERRTDRQEGVRIIAAEEAQAALEAGQAAGRRAEDQLRFGDVPPAPTGPRPQHRFPMPESVDPAAVPRPSPASPATPLDRPSVARGARAVSADEAHDPRPWDVRQSDAAMAAEEDPSGFAAEAGGTQGGRTDDSGAGEKAPVWPATAPAPAVADPALEHQELTVEPEPTEPQPIARVDEPAAAEPAEAPPDPVPPPPAPRSSWDDPSARPWATGASAPPPPPWELARMDNPDAPPAVAPDPEPDPDPDPEPAQEAITMSGGSGTDMPHWTDPPTGEVPKILAGEPEEEEDMAAWRALGSRGVRWRDEGDDWDDAPLEDLGDEETRVGAFRHLAVGAFRPLLVRRGLLPTGRGAFGGARRRRRLRRNRVRGGGGRGARRCLRPTGRGGRFLLRAGPPN